jgi:hypothetical protein
MAEAVAAEVEGAIKAVAGTMVVETMAMVDITTTAAITTAATIIMAAIIIISVLRLSASTPAMALGMALARVLAGITVGMVTADMGLAAMVSVGLIIPLITPTPQ